MAAEDRQCRLVLQNGEQGLAAAPQAEKLLDQAAAEAAPATAAATDRAAAAKAAPAGEAAAAAEVAPATAAAPGATTPSAGPTSGNRGDPGQGGEAPLAFPALDDSSDEEDAPGAVPAKGAGPSAAGSAPAHSAAPAHASRGSAQSFNPFGLENGSTPPRAPGPKAPGATTGLGGNPFGPTPSPPGARKVATSPSPGARKVPTSPSPGAPRRRSLPPLPPNALTAGDARDDGGPGRSINFSDTGSRGTAGRTFVLTPEEQQNWEDGDSSV